jgi:hypothetical protein
MADSGAAKRLTDEQLVAMLDLVKDADSVELKVTVPDVGHRSSIAALGIDPLDAQIRQVFFFDTPDLALDRAGVVVRARRIAGKGDDSVVKLRPVVPAELPAEIRRSPAFNVEVDAMPGGYVCSASMKGRPATGDVKRAIAGEVPMRRLFSKEQRAFFAAHAPAGADLEGLSVLGPIFVLKDAWIPEGFGRRLVAEMWLYPNGERILELSTKCLPAEALMVAGQARVFLTRRGISLSGHQQTKTRTALEFFSAELRAGAEG